MDRENRLLLVILAAAFALLMVICVVGTAFVFFVYSSTGPMTPEPSSISAAPQVVETPLPTALATPRPRQGQTLILRPLSEPLTFDPQLIQDAASSEYAVHIFSTLVGIDHDLKLVPDLAESWDLSPDGRTYTFTLRQGATFQDGKPVTANDVKYSFGRALDPATKSPVAATYLGDIVGAHDRLANKTHDVSGVKVIDDRTVQITIDEPKSYFLWQLTYPVASILDQANVESGGAAWADSPNGSGPFKLVSRSSSEIDLARNDLFYGPKPKLDAVRFLLAGDAMASYERGDIDMVQVTAADIDRVTDELNPLSKELVVADQFSLSYLGFDVSVPPFDDPKVRQAMAMAIDKDKLVSVVLNGMAAKADGILPPGLPGYGQSLKAMPYDPAQAQQLLAQSKYAGNMPPIKLYVLGTGSEPVGTPPAIQDMLKQNLGLDVEIQLVDAASFFNGLIEHKWPLFVTGWIADYPDAYDFLDVLFHSKSPLNHGNYSNPQVDALLEQARVEQDEGKRTQLYQQAEQILVSEAAVIPLDFERDYWLVKPYVKGVTRPPMIIRWLDTVSIEGQPQ
jgi:oligopeptide transport system substrate-binding protein